MDHEARNRKRLLRRLAGGAICFSLIGVAIAAVTLRQPGVQRLQADLAEFGIPVTTGAAPGFVPDQTCQSCHPEIYTSYQEVGMARSFFRPSPDKKIEDFENNHYYHEPSQIHYEMQWEDGNLVFKQYQVDEAGQPIHLYERRVDWIMGSGNHSRSYIYQTEVGELFQFPIAWYSQPKAWRMAPGFDRPGHLGLSRSVHRECMFCHNAYPDVPEGADVRGAEPRFPHQLPEGTGCQRCHGPGAAHVQAALAEGADDATIRDRIVNPSRLEPKLRSDVCYQCHMLPSVALIGVRRFGRADYSFVAGQSLDEFQVRMEIKEEGLSAAQRFEINHHPYRLQQSRCWRESEGKLECLTCHDPHRKVAPAERSTHFREACLTCHQSQDCRGFGPAPAEAPAEADCVSCHMPKRRTQDVVHVVMTDHRIQRRAAPSQENLKPLEEHERVLLDAMVVSDLGSEEAFRELYRLTAVVRAIPPTRSPLEALDRMLAGRKDVPFEARLDLLGGLLKGRRYREALFAASEFLPSHPDHPLALEWQALALAGLGRMDEAVDGLRRAVELDPSRAETHFNLGRILAGKDRPEEALVEFRKAIEMLPEMAAAWFQLGRVLGQQSRSEEAIESLKVALALEPRLARPYLAIADEWTKLGKKEEAIRYLRHGLRVAVGTDEIAAALEKLTSETDTKQPQSGSNPEGG